MADEVAKEEDILAIIGNIPDFYHSRHLRNFFSQFIETNGFKCFHFRHRPEGIPNKNSKNVDVQVTSTPDRDNSNKTKQCKRLCCLVKVNSERFSELMQLYNKHHWLNEQGESIPLVCRIVQVDVSKGKGQSSKYKTRKEQKQILPEREAFTEDDLKNMIELRPPPLMPQGNVGTPTKFFLEQIQQCRLPPNIIKKLSLTFPKSRGNHKYSNVSFDYHTEVVANGDNEEYTAKSGSGHHIVKEDETLKDKTHEETSEKCRDKDDGAQSEKSEQDADDCEEWERHEALHDDPANAERDKNKDRLYEERIELKWEKGGSGLVFYTDAQYWKQQEGDFDEQTADDWDVDMSVYYETDGGDKDARDHAQMRLEARRRAGEGADTINQQFYSNEIGKFEKHTKGIGRKVMEKHGWSDGQGLGSSKPGIAEALDSDGQHPRVKTGLGYVGEPIHRYGPSAPKRRREPGIITTIYDDPEETDPQEPIMRRHDHYGLKYRDSHVAEMRFCKAKNPD